MPRAVCRGRRRQSTPTFEPPDFRAGRGLLQTVAMLADTLCAAINAHDIDAFMACFDDDYDSAQPVHPGREFHGSEQVRRNWTALFREVPDGWTVVGAILIVGSGIYTLHRETVRRRSLTADASMAL